MIRVAPSMQHRRAFRHEAKLACQVVRVSDFRLVADSTLDVSTRGLCVPTRARVLTGEALLVSFKVPRTNHWIDADATVVRVIHGRRPGDRGGRALGLQLHGLDDGARRVLFDSLRFSPPPGRSTSKQARDTTSPGMRHRRELWLDSHINL